MNVRAAVIGFLAGLLAGLPTAMAESGAGAWVENPQSAARLISGVTATGDGGDLPLGLEITLKPGWKTYWRAPGDAGFPPELDFSTSASIAKAKLDFPAPHRFELFGLQTFGYGEQVIFPIHARQTTPGAPVAIRAHLRYLVCADVCIPYDADLALDLPSGDPQASAVAPLLAAWQARVPGDGAVAGFDIAKIDVTAATVSVLAISQAAPFAAPDLMAEAPSGFAFGKTQVSLSDGGKSAHFVIPVLRQDGAPAGAPKGLRLTLIDGDRSMERWTDGAGPALPAQSSAPARALWSVLLIAVLGGLILNAMPCVLPVLALKLAGLMQQGERDRDQVRINFLATAAGIVTAFLALAMVLVLLKQGGHAIGWGIQFQQPIFLAVLAAICMLFAFSLWDLIRIPMPAVAGNWALAADRAAARGRVSQHRAMDGPLSGFLSGIFATILATPCSAPFVGTAVGFALAAGPAEIVMIFLAMALGLALPYLAVAAVPSLAGFLPRPGRWMIGLRRILGVSLALTALWLVWVLAAQIGERTSSPRVVEPGAVAWQAFDPTGIQRAVAEGKVVFVDVTADWCLTCKVNEALVLDRSPVRERLSAVIAQRADWTLPNPVIADFLAGYGRYGIPFYVVFGPKAPNGTPLSELLTDSSVLKALDDAAVP